MRATMIQPMPVQAAPALSAAVDRAEHARNDSGQPARTLDESRRPKAQRRTPPPATQSRPLAPATRPMQAGESRPTTTQDPSINRDSLVTAETASDSATAPASDIDLRRLHTKADQLRTILDRAALADIPDADQRLLRAVFERGMSVQDLALSACAGWTPESGSTGRDHGVEAIPQHCASEKTSAHRPDLRSPPSHAASLARSLRRRVRALTTRLADPRFIFVLRHQRDWPPKRRAVARACIILGLSQRAAAHELRLTLHDVRQEFHTIQALYQVKAEASGNRH